MTVVTVPGAVAYDYGDPHPDQRGWWTCCPGCKESSLLTAHEVTHRYVEGKGTVPNITPSCVCRCGAHWFVTRGEVVMA